MDECVCTLTPQATCTLNFARIQVVYILLLYSKTRHRVCMVVDVCHHYEVMT